MYLILWIKINWIINKTINFLWIIIIGEYKTNANNKTKTIQNSKNKPIQRVKNKSEIEICLKLMTKKDKKLSIFLYNRYPILNFKLKTIQWTPTPFRS